MKPISLSRCPSKVISCLRRTSDSRPPPRPPPKPPAARLQTAAEPRATCTAATADAATAAKALATRAAWMLASFRNRIAEGVVARTATGEPRRPEAARFPAVRSPPLGRPPGVRLPALDAVPPQLRRDLLAGYRRAPRQRLRQALPRPHRALPRRPHQAQRRPARTCCPFRPRKSMRFVAPRRCCDCRRFCRNIGIAVAHTLPMYRIVHPVIAVAAVDIVDADIAIDVDVVAAGSSRRPNIRRRPTARAHSRSERNALRNHARGEISRRAEWFRG